MIGWYVKLPVKVEALKWDGTNFDELKEFVGDDLIVEAPTPFAVSSGGFCMSRLFLRTLEGKMELSIGNYVIRGIRGEFYPCRADIFDETYKEVEDDS